MSIDFQELSKTFDGKTYLVKNLSFSLPSKKFSGLLGPSGCGKTTILRMLAGLDKPSRGRIEVEKELFTDVGKKFFLAPERRNVSMVFQSYAVWPHMNVFDNVAFPLKIKGLTKNEIKNRVADLLENVGLQGLEARMPAALSGGQQQRVALARALGQRPKVLLLDEPLSNLDAHLRESMRQQIKELQKKFEMTCVIVTHDWADAKSLCDHLVVLRSGEIEQEGPLEEIRAHPKSYFVGQLTKEL